MTDLSLAAMILSALGLLAIACVFFVPLISALTSTQRCGNCRFAVAGKNPKNPSEGACRAELPNFIQGEGGFGAIQTPVHLEQMWCGKYQRRRLWHRLFGPKTGL